MGGIGHCCAVSTEQNRDKIPVATNTCEIYFIVLLLIHDRACEILAPFQDRELILYMNMFQSPGVDLCNTIYLSIA